MKKISIIVFCALCTILSAQIVEQKVIEAENAMGFGFIQLETAGQKYFVFDADELKYTFYNLDHSIFKEVEIQLSWFDVDNLFDMDICTYPTFISERLFNTDDKFEFLLHSYYKTIIINEDGNIIFEKDRFKPASDYMSELQFPNYIQTTEDGTLMTLENSNRDSVIIYSLPGVVPCYSCESENEVSTKSQTTKSEEISLSAFPNPARNFVTINYDIPQGEKKAEIQICNLNGKIVKEYNVDKTFNNLKISTDALPTGTYIYYILTDSFTSKGQKLLIKE